MKLEEFRDALLAAARMVEDAEKSPFSGWGLYTRSDKIKQLFDWVDLGRGSGCTSSTCLHNSHSPYAHHRAAVPKAGVRVVELGYEGGFVYALIRDDEIVLCRIVRPQHHWARIEELEMKDVSEGLRAEIAEKLGIKTEEGKQ